jgi:preprotein translocase subunit SecG
MKRLVYVVAALFFITTIFLIACETPQQKMVETEKTELKTKIMATQDSLEQKSSQLRSNVEELDETQQQELEQLQQYQEELDAKLQKIENATVKDWETVKGETAKFIQSAKEDIKAEMEEMAPEEEMQ